MFKIVVHKFKMPNVQSLQSCMDAHVGQIKHKVYQASLMMLIFVQKYQVRKKYRIETAYQQISILRLKQKLSHCFKKSKSFVMKMCSCMIIIYKFLDAPIHILLYVSRRKMETVECLGRSRKVTQLILYCMDISWPYHNSTSFVYLGL